MNLRDFNLNLANLRFNDNNKEKGKDKVDVSKKTTEYFKQIFE
jgi:hypothetical protein